MFHFVSNRMNLFFFFKKKKLTLYCFVSVYSTHQLVPISQDDDLPTLANKLDDELELQPQSLIIENVNSDDEYDYQIHNDIVKYEQQSLVNK